MSTKKPSIEDLDLAVQWLEVYEGDDAESLAAMQRVVAWMQGITEAEALRQACREAGVTVKQARKALRAKADTQRALDRLSKQ